MKAGSDGARTFLIIFWAISIIINTIVDATYRVQAGIFWGWIFAPLLTILYGMIVISSKYFKRA